MTKLGNLCTAFLMLGLLAGCRGRHSQTEVKNEEPAPGSARLVSQLNMDDPDTAAQLTQGFYPPEAGGWRWTTGKFAVILKSPPGSAEKGATLTFAFALPDDVVRKVGPVTLAASAGGKPLRSETFQAGKNFFTADIPPELLTGESVAVDFALDKSLPAGAVDKRELGLVATSVGLETK